jgi:predicted 3-demethylubiquinone-9 3-methyltransferase (glyoxalase superfamily)
MNKNTICLRYNKDAEDAVRFYAEIFPNSGSEPCIARRATIRTARKAMC